MTPQELDAIRARDAAVENIAREGEQGAWAILDRRALLAEVDRLTAALDVCIALKEREVDDYRARAAVAEERASILSDAMVDRNMDRWNRGVAAERARIRAAVEGLPSAITAHNCWDDHEGPDGTDLDAIRAAHYPMTGEEDWCVGCQDGGYPCDVVALLAEVDRLRAGCLDEVHRVSTAAWENGEAMERARIRTAVEGLPVRTYPHVWSEVLVDRAAVLAAIDGETDR